MTLRWERSPYPTPPQQGEHKEDWNRSLTANSYNEHHPLQAVLRSCLVTPGQLVCPTCVTVKASFRKHASVVCSLKVSPLPPSSAGLLNLSTRLRAFTLPASQRPVHGGGVSFELSGGAKLSVSCVSRGVGWTVPTEALWLVTTK